MTGFGDETFFHNYCENPCGNLGPEQVYCFENKRVLINCTFFVHRCPGASPGHQGSDRIEMERAKEEV